MNKKRVFHLKTSIAGVVLASFLVLPPVASAVTVPFIENFTNDVADWADAGNFPLTFVATGGPGGGGYASTDFAFSSGGGAGGSSAVLFRGQDEFGTSGSSGGAFIGNWMANGVSNLTAFVRHNAPVPVSFFTRFSRPFNFPGATAVQFAPVLPNTWTQLSFDINALNPQFVSFEGTDFATVFSNVGHLQLGVSIPTGFESNPTSFTFDLDQVQIIPEPSSLCLLGLALAASWGFSSRRI
ncbi:MAG: PEP-CTERM sorting domain-containing protein [Pirellulales bacterium]|nr:PEP-CTERM sorting domain-containing protein [Pirellulales bacterium]